MPEISPSPRTPDQLAAIQRRALPVAIAGFLFGAGALFLLFKTQVDVGRPPNLLAANLSYCAILMGVGILFYAKGAPGTGIARVLCIFAILAGMVGPVIYSKQAVDWHKHMEDREGQNAAAIAKAARMFAADHGGVYPKDFLELVAGGYLKPEQLLSPFGGAGSEFVAKQKLAHDAPNRGAVIAEHADYTYTGADLRLPIKAELESKIIVVYETDPVKRQYFAIGFADGRSEFLNKEDGQKAMTACNAARKELGLKELSEPESVKRAREADAGKP